MNKALQKYGKSRWINTRLARPYKMRLMLKRMKLAALASTGYSHLSSIASCDAPYAEKAIAIAKAVDSFYKSMTMALGGDLKEKGL